jgi:hypothetical protein
MAELKGRNSVKEQVKQSRVSSTRKCLGTICDFIFVSYLTFGKHNKEKPPKWLIYFSEDFRLENKKWLKEFPRTSFCSPILNHLSQV